MDSKAAEIFREIVNFTHDSYSRLLKFLKERYTIVTFQDFERAPLPKLILRHDVDVSLIPALEMAKIENILGINSAYFVCLSTRFYNLFEESNLKRLREISEMGHEIGIHYDVSQYKAYNQPFEESLSFEISILEKLAKRPVMTIAQHDVSLTDEDPFEGCREPQNAYNKEFFSNAHYVSDSCRAWSLEDVYQLLTLDFPVVQLLIHPILWHKTICTRNELLDFFFEKLEKENMEYKKYWKSTWEKTDRVQTFDKEISQLLSSLIE